MDNVTVWRTPWQYPIDDTVYYFMIKNGTVYSCPLPLETYSLDENDLVGIYPAIYYGAPGAVALSPGLKLYYTGNIDEAKFSLRMPDINLSSGEKLQYSLLHQRPDRELEADGIVEVLADENLGIDLLELDVLVAGDFELLGHHAGVGHGEGPRAAGLRILAGRRQISQHDLLCQAEPRIILDAAPDDHRHDAAGPKALAHIA